MHKIALVAVVLAASLAFSQAQQAGQRNQDIVGKGTTGLMPDIGSPTAFSEASNLSGCLMQQNGRFWLSESANGSVYALEADNLAQYEHHVVRVAGHPMVAPQYSGRMLEFHVDRIKETGELCNTQANEQLPGIAITGKAGNKGDVFTETTTHVETPTAGAETQAGVLQKEGKSGYVHEPLSIFERVGHPPNWELVGHSTGAAADLAASAEQTEVGAPEGTYGVQNTRPNYQNPKNSQEIGGAQSPMQGSANAVGSMQVNPNSPTSRITGCVSQANGHWQLASGQKRYQLQGNIANLRGWEGHTVAANGRFNKGSTFEVGSVQDLAPTCSTK